MGIFHWSKSNSVFLPEMDDEHRTIFQATGELQNALDSGAPLLQVQEILHRLMSCVEDHLAHEEKLMRNSRYPSFDWHRRQHNTARRRLGQYAPLIEAGDRQAGAELTEFLARWLEDHTSVTDRMLGAHLRNQERALIR